MKNDVTLASRPNEDKQGPRDFNSQARRPSVAQQWLDGVSVETLTPDIAKQIGVPLSTKGVVVDSVDPGSPAAEAQPPLERGDVITQVNRQPVANDEDYNRLVSIGQG